MAKPNVAAIFDLINKAQTSQSLQELSFLLVNLSKQLVVYEQAFLYQEGKGFIAISGLSEVDHNSPMLIWFKEFIRELHQEGITEHIPRKARGLRYIKDLDQWFANELTLIPPPVDDAVDPIKPIIIILPIIKTDNRLIIIILHNEIELLI